MKKIELYSEHKKIDFDVTDLKNLNNVVKNNRVNIIKISGDFENETISLFNLELTVLSISNLEIFDLTLSNCVIRHLSISSSYPLTESQNFNYFDSLRLENCVVKYGIFKNLKINSLLLVDTIFKSIDFKSNKIGKGKITMCEILKGEFYSNCFAPEFGFNFKFTNLKGCEFIMNEFFTSPVGNLVCVDTFYKNSKAVFQECNCFEIEFSENKFNYNLVDDLFVDGLFYECMGISKLTPQSCSFIGWKSALNGETVVLVKLLIPEDALVCNNTYYKCRCSKAKVLSITDKSETNNYDVAVSEYDDKFVYKVGEDVEVFYFEKNNTIDCAPGIHFFIDKQMAMNYIL